MVNHLVARSRLSNIVGAGALIPYKRGDDDVGWFISYSHS